MVNHITYGGNLTHDPELRYTPKGTAVLEVSIANNHRWFDDQGNKHEETVFASAVLWGKQAETFAQYHRKGQQCLIEGRLSQESWEDKQTGQKRTRTKIKVSAFHFLNGGTRATAPATTAAPPPPSAPRQAPAPAAEAAEPPSDGGPPPGEDDDVPF